MAEKTVQTENFTCSSCGGTMIFNIKKQQFACSACGTVGAIQSLNSKVIEYPLRDYARREMEGSAFNGVAGVACKNCGVEIIFGEHDTATKCPMCGATQIFTSKQITGIPPEGLIPFQIDKSDAQELFRKWIKGMWFAPNKLKKSYGEGSLKGLFVPFWTFDTDAYAEYVGRGGKEYTEKDKDGKDVTKVNWYNVSGSVSQSYDDIQICATDDPESRNIINGALPYNTKTGTLPYSPQYLSGFYAQRYSIKADVCFESAKSGIESSLRAAANSDIISHGYDRSSITSMQVTYSNEKYKHVLLPVWLSVFAYSGKTYEYGINGETGAVFGKRPYSIPKIIFAILTAMVIIGTIVAMFGGEETEAMPLTETTQLNIVQTVENTYIADTALESLLLKQ